MKKLSVVTVCHKSNDLLPRYIDSFLAHNGGGAIEFIFVENSGDTRIENHAARLGSAGFDVQVIYTENDGFGAGCNRGADVASGDLLAFVNPDVEFRSSLAELDDCFSSSQWGTVRQIDKKGRVYSFDLSLEFQGVLTTLIAMSRFLHLVLPFVGNMVYPVGSFFVVERSLFEKVGRFDERFFMYHEEAELARRLRAEAGRPGYCSRVEVYHAGLGTQPDKNSAFAHEIKGLQTYCEVTSQPELFAKRLRIFRILSRLSKVAARRAAMMEDAA